MIFMNKHLSTLSLLGLGGPHIVRGAKPADFARGPATQAEPITAGENSAVRHKLAEYLQAHVRDFSDRQQEVALQFVDLMEKVGERLKAKEGGYALQVWLADDPSTSLEVKHDSLLVHLEMSSIQYRAIKAELAGGYTHMDALKRLFREDPGDTHDRQGYRYSLYHSKSD